MDKEQLGKLAQDMRDLITEYKVPVEIFTLLIQVPREYYQTIKENFPDRHAMDVIVGSGEVNWSIDILYSRLSAGENDPPQGQ